MCAIEQGVHRDGVMSRSLPLALEPADLPVSTATADRELAGSGAQREERPVTGDCFDGDSYPVLSAEAQIELVTHVQTTAALRAAAVTPRRGSRAARLVAEHLAGADYYSGALVGSVFRLVKKLIAEDLGVGARRLSDDVYADVVADAYETVIEAALSFDAQRGANFASWVGQRVRPAIRAARRRARESGRWSPVEERVLRRMQVVSEALVNDLGRQPTREEVFAATREACWQWNLERAHGSNARARATDARARMRRSGESAVLEERLELLYAHRHLSESPLDRALRGDGSGEGWVPPALRDETVPEDRLEGVEELAELLALATYARGAEPSTVAGVRATREWSRTLAAPHLQYCALATGVEDQFVEDDLVARARRRARRNERVGVCLIEP